MDVTLCNRVFAFEKFTDMVYIYSYAFSFNGKVVCITKHTSTFFTIGN